MAQLVGKGRIAFSNDPITAGLITTPTTATRAAVQAILNALLSQAIATDPTLAENVTDAAVAAVAAEIAAGGIPRTVLARYPGIPDAVLGLTFDDSKKTPTWLLSRADGGVPRRIAEEVIGVVSEPSKIWAFAVYDKATKKVTFGRRKDGSWVGLGGTTTTATRKVRVLIEAGQSNRVGKADEPSTVLDPPNPRIFMATNSGEIVAAAEPVITLDTQVRKGATLQRARLMAAKYPDDDILIISYALGGTGFFSPVDTPSQRWDPTATGNLYTGLKDKITATQPAVFARWGTNVEYAGMAWHQGEADRARTEAEYAAMLDLLIDGIRTHVGVPDLPVTIGQIAREYIDAENITAITRAHMNTPNRKTRTAFAPTQYGWVGFDGIHFSREGYDGLAASEFDALFRAIRNVTGLNPERVRNLTARRTGPDVEVSWTLPGARSTGFTVEWSTNGTTWVSTGVTQLNGMAPYATIINPGTGKVWVRVTTTNETASITSSPVTV